jgi:hypothetical protein
MLNGLKQYLFLVVDQETKGILTKCSSMNTANAVSKGILNSSPMLVIYPHLNHNINKYSTDYTLNYKLVRDIVPDDKNMPSEMCVYDTTPNINSKNVFSLIPISTDPTWLEKRKLANYRSLKMAYLELTCERYMARIKNFAGDELFFQYLGKQLELVDVATNCFPDCIKEWADINEVSDSAAYYELKMIYDSLGITVFRIHAIWSKYVEKINNTYSEEEFDKIRLFSNLESEFKFGKK